LLIFPLWIFIVSVYILLDNLSGPAHPASIDGEG
jgi:hypothetical protein